MRMRRSEIASDVGASSLRELGDVRDLFYSAFSGSGVYGSHTTSQRHSQFTRMIPSYKNSFLRRSPMEATSFHRKLPRFTNPFDASTEHGLIRNFARRSSFTLRSSFLTRSNLGHIMMLT